jgi:hypothetical protein
VALPGAGRYCAGGQRGLPTVGAYTPAFIVIEP